MDEETQKKIFDPFFTTKATGRGLGMSAMLGIVTGHHGGLHIYSKKDQGTTFKVVFPFLAEVEMAAELAKSEVDSPSKMTGMVLIVDDEESIREVAGVMLKSFGFDTLVAKDGVEGVEVFQQYHSSISFVLLDMTMPRMNGQACYAELRKIKPDVKVILSSGYSEQEATNRFSNEGLAGFVQKPYSVGDLGEVISEALGR